jgi:Xaa-Pro aminopeptidase
MDAVSVDALVVHLARQRDLSDNFTGTAAIVMLTPTQVIFLTDSRYVTALADAQATDHACPDLDVVVVAGSYDGALAQTICERGWLRVGFEAAHLTVSRFRWFEEQVARSAGVTLIPTEGLVERARVTKDEYELGVLKEAGRRLSVAAERVLREIHGGMTELDAAFHIEACLRDAGFSKPAFETIVASGPNSALPHARPTERRLTASDLVVLDFGGVYDSYCVDLTRTVAIRPASDRSRAVHRAVLAAHAGAVAAAGPGQSRFAIDAAAREVLAAAEWERPSGTGQGMGLASRFTRIPASCGAGLTSTPATNLSVRAWSSRSNPARTSPAGEACESKTMWSSRSAASNS